MKSMNLLAGLLIAALLFVAGHSSAGEKPAQKSSKPEIKMAAGKADVLRVVPKKFAAFVEHDPAKAIVTLRFEGEKEPQVWPVITGADIRVRGWWGRLEQFQKGDRVWVWLGVDRQKKPRGILMLADEISEQDIHELPVVIQAVDVIGDRRTVTVKSSRKKERTLQVAANLAEVPVPSSKVYLQSAGDQARLLLTAEQLETERKQQQEYMRQQWKKFGLPGTVSFLHALGGEMEVMLDHEAIRWGRYLKNGDKITLKSAGVTGDFKPIRAVVKKVQPWRDCTRLLLVTTSGLDQLDLTIGQRIRAVVPEPPAALDQAEWPLDMDRPRSKEERLDWFMSTVYCPCGIAGDRCTGMFYTLGSCNMHGCGMPKFMRNVIGELIDQGKTDRQILDQLRQEYGPKLLRPHLLQ
jgi:hypothetical protein